MTFLERNSLVAFYYPSVSVFWPDKRWVCVCVGGGGGGGGGILVGSYKRALLKMQMLKFTSRNQVSDFLWELQAF